MPTTSQPPHPTGHVLIGVATLERVSLDRILIRPNRYRMDGRHVAAVADNLGDDFDAPPVLLQQLANDYFRLLDGRHRFIAAMIAGRSDLLAVVVERVTTTEMRTRTTVENDGLLLVPPGITEEAS